MSFTVNVTFINSTTVFCKIQTEFLNYKLNEGSLKTVDSIQYKSHKEKYNMVTKTTKILIQNDGVHYIWPSILIVKPTRCTNFSYLLFGIKRYMFRTVPLSIMRSFSLYTQQWYMSYTFVDSLRASCRQTCMTYTIDMCTLKNSS